MNAYIIDGVFTPRASVKKGLSAYSAVHPQELVATCIRSLAERQGEIVRQASAAYIGCVTEIGDQGANLARNAVLAAGLDPSVSAMTINMCCGSGLQTVNLAAASVATGAEQLLIAGGVESMSRVKMGTDGGFMDGNNLSLRQKLYQVPQGISADFIATTEGITRDELDRYALDSQRKAAKARDKGYFQSSYALVKGEDGNPLLTDEDHIRPDATLEALSALPPAFAQLGQAFTQQGIIGEGKAIAKLNYFHTAGNSSGIADGAAALLIAGDAFLAQTNAKPRAKILATCARGSDPISMLTGPAACCTDLLRSSGMAVDDVDLWEINEAFAVVPIQTMRRLNIAADKVNTKGGAIARGHPLGATGAILLTSVVEELEIDDLEIGCVVLCVAGGQSVACLVQRI